MNASSFHQQLEIENLKAKVKLLCGCCNGEELVSVLTEREEELRSKDARYISALAAFEVERSDYVDMIRGLNTRFRSQSNGLASHLEMERGENEALRMRLTDISARPAFVKDELISQLSKEQLYGRIIGSKLKILDREQRDCKAVAGRAQELSLEWNNPFLFCLKKKWNWNGRGRNRQWFVLFTEFRLKLVPLLGKHNYFILPEKRNKNE
jgi:hypothetical protein